MDYPNKKERLELLIQRFGDNKKSVFARFLGISPQAVNSWIKRQTFDIELIYSKCVDVSAHWLLTGEGDMIKGESVIFIPQKSTPQTVFDPTIVYRSDPKDTEIIELQRRQIRLLEEKLDDLKTGQNI